MESDRGRGLGDDGPVSNDGEVEPAAARGAKPPHLTVEIPAGGCSEDSVSADASSPPPRTPVFLPSRPGRMASPAWNPCSPLRTMGASSPRPSTPSVRRLLDRLSVKFRAAGGSPSVSQSLKGGSLHRFASPGPSSVPVTPVDDKRRLSRSLSEPQTRKRANGRRGASSPRAVFRVVPALPPAADADGGSSSEAEPSAGGEEIPVEEAVCRICLTELEEGGDGMKLQCNCKGSLALAHRECAVQWFSVKGNKTCDVCLHDVGNLPVTLVLHNPPSADAARAAGAEAATARTWAYLAILLVVSVLAYCSLLELLLAQRGMAAAAVSLPCGILLGLLASFTSVAMANSPRTVFLYAAVQFALVLLSVYLFLSLFRLHILASTLLATSAGFGLAMCARTVAVRCMRWRRRRQALAGSLSP
ncbi:uncharacterized protein LOC144710112 [Wolffia australiana]